MRNRLQGLDKSRLRRWLLLFFFALAIPAGVLIAHAYSQLKWEAFHQYQVQAEQLAGRIDRRLVSLIEAEEARSFADYSFLVVAGDPAANYVQRSPLSDFPLDSAMPGLLGYFQVDADGRLSSPLLPASGGVAAYGITMEEEAQRRAQIASLRRILSENRLVQAGTLPSPVMVAVAADKDESIEREQVAGLAEEGYRAASEEARVTSQAAFDRLSRQRLSPAEEKKKREAPRKAEQQLRVEDLKLDQRYQTQQKQQALEDDLAKGLSSQFDKRAGRKERSALPVLVPTSEPAPMVAGKLTRDDAPALRIRTFESEIDPFEISLLDSGQLVLFRKVWRDGQRYIQGLLLERQPFLHGVVEQVFAESALAGMSDLTLAYQDNVFASFNGRTGRTYLSRSGELTGELSGALLHQSRLSDPMSEMELIFSIRQLPAGPGAAVVTALAAVMLLVLCLGFYFMYRLGVRQIELARQQQDFVSAVSHELKTPLTSIRMYGEMLREGWASEEKKRSYYDYIFEESERLSRLIGNVLQLARMTRNELPVNLRSVTVGELIDNIRSKVSAQVERAGFELAIDCDDVSRQTELLLDADNFSQIVINLVDNALKFSAKAETRRIEISCAKQADGSVLFRLRDHGPGIARDQMKKIFKLFYRAENELTRETLGTGIGLALVHQLVTAMDGRVDVVNRRPGAEFRLLFPPA